MSSNEQRQDLEIETGSVSDFFREAVADAAKTCGLDTSSASEQYLSGVLADFATAELTGDQALSRPIVFALVDALKTAGAERFQRLRVLGDEVLYLSGFFGPHLDRRGVEREYINGLGAAAYDHAASTLRRSGRGLGTDLFDELAHNFDGFVSMFEVVADSFYAKQVRGPRDLVDAYERWLKTGNSMIADVLRQHGMVPVRGDDTVH